MTRGRTTIAITMTKILIKLGPAECAWIKISNWIWTREHIQRTCLFHLLLDYAIFCVDWLLDSLCTNFIIFMLLNFNIRRTFSSDTHTKRERERHKKRETNLSERQFGQCVYSIDRLMPNVRTLLCAFYVGLCQYLWCYSTCYIVLRHVKVHRMQHTHNIFIYNTYRAKPRDLFAFARKRSRKKN